MRSNGPNRFDSINRNQWLKMPQLSLPACSLIVKALLMFAKALLHFDSLCKGIQASKELRTA